MTEGFEMEFRPTGLLKGAEGLARIVAKIPAEVVEELDDDGYGPMRWRSKSASRLIDPEGARITPPQWKTLQERIAKQEGSLLGIFEEGIAGVASNPGVCMIACPCTLVARWEAGRIVMLQRYDLDWDHEDRELGRFDEPPTFGEVIRLVGLILNDPEWLDGEIRPTWQESLAIQEVEQPYGWELSVASGAYPLLGEWFANEWQRVLCSLPEEDAESELEED